jgi:ABC-type sugar transport system substrate-binding protein
MAKLRPGVKISGPEVTTTDPTQDFGDWQRITQQNPTALGFFGVCDSDLAALVKVKQSSPGSKWLVGVTAGADDPVGLAPLKTGAMVAAVTQRPYVQGYVGMTYILNNIIKHTAMPNGWLNSGFDLVDGANVDQIKSVLESPTVASKYYSGDISTLLTNPTPITPMSNELTGVSNPNINP